jgi:glycosyltransferase involved in cell wall biosynthesis
MNNPLVSVLMTAYNREKYIGEAIESVLLSTYNNFELIIVDDCSRDMTVSIAKKFEATDDRIKVYVNEKNLGDYPNRNKAASYAKGEYIMYLDSDDKTYPDSIEYCVNEMREDSKIDMGMLCRIPELCGKILCPSQSINHHFFSNQILIIGPGGTIIKKSFFDKINQYPEKYGPANDMYFNLKAASVGNIKYLCKEFLFYRIHEGQEANNGLSYLSNNYLYTKDALKELQLPLSKEQLNFLSLKSKRRFVHNIFKFLVESKSISQTYMVIKKCNFTVKDALQGIFH